MSDPAVVDDITETEIWKKEVGDIEPKVEMEESISIADAFRKSSINSTDLKEIDIPPRKPLLSTFFKEGDLGFIFAPRGLGKTWLSMGIARAIAEGTSIGPWKAHGRNKVLYIDGEMALDSIKERDRLLSKSTGDLIYLNHEYLFHQTEKVLNLTDRDAQDATLALCVEWGVKVVFLDNLSCLFSGVAENQADEWEQILPWLLQMRRRKIAVVIIHHANRSGQNMRGTSRREDAVSWILKLEEDRSDTGSHGARFISRFTKCRELSSTETIPFTWHFRPSGDGLEIQTKESGNMEIFIAWIRDGLTSATDIANEMGITKGMVSRLAKAAIADGRIEKDGRDYKLKQ